MQEYDKLIRGYSNEEFNWQEYDERLPHFEDLVITIFKNFCMNNGSRVTEIPSRIIPGYFPRLVKDFYRKCAPVDLTVGDIVFLPYDQVFECADRSGGEIIPIGYKGRILPGGQNAIYMDKELNGIDFDPRVQLAIGNAKVRILGTNIFTFISGISYNRIEVPYLDD